MSRKQHPHAPVLINGLFCGRVRHWRGREGSAVLLLCLAMVALIGFMAVSVDYGLMALKANALQRGCDAAALAATTEMLISGSTSTAQTQAQTYGAQNGATITSVVFSNSNTVVTVQGTATQSFFFAQVLGIGSGTLNRQAKAYCIDITGVSNGVPLGITTDDFNAHVGGASFTVSLIRNQDTAFADGNVVGLALTNGKSPSHWDTYLQNGYSNVPVYMGYTVDYNSLNASLKEQEKNLYDGLSGRIGGIMAIFITDPTPATNGNSIHPIEGIAVVQLTGVDNSGNVSLKILKGINDYTGGLYNTTTASSLQLTNAYKMGLENP
ncbi:MAG: pilus assembly protein TadG-related protein [Methylacidiphilales bacterium]|nr:pilus assembly protein TadG-related protein [Candidatus Methylacidiphilales bacterium]